MAQLKHVVLLATADWDNPFWTNKQFVARELAKSGCQVLYVESLGLRAPSARGADIRRILKRLLRGFRKPRQVEENIHVFSPVVIPLQKYSLVRKLNTWWLKWVLFRALKSLGFERDLLWTYNPLTTRLLDTRRFNTIVYHCVDEIKAQPGMPAIEIELAERELLLCSDVTFVTSQTLLESKRGLSRNIHLFENVADFDHFNRALDKNLSVPTEMLSMQKPVIGFVGAISSYKVDFELLRFVAKTHPDWTLVLIGKIGEGEPGTDASILALDNIHILGPRPYGELPAYLKAIDVAIIPVRLNDYTHSMFPMKLFEYLSAGKRVVSTNIDSLKEYSNFISVSNTYDDFVFNIEKILADVVDDKLDERLALSEKNTYKVRTKKMLDIVDGLAK